MNEAERELELRIYARRVSWAIVFVGGLLFIGGLRLSGMDLEKLETRSRMFKPGQHVCLKSEWLETTAGVKDRVEICTEWIDLKDTSGNTHQLVRGDLEILKDSNGRFRTKLKNRMNYPLVGAILFLAVLIAIGKWLQRHWIEKRRIRLGLTATRE